MLLKSNKISLGPQKLKIQKLSNFFFVIITRIDRVRKG